MYTSSFVDNVLKVCFWPVASSSSPSKAVSQSPAAWSSSHRRRLTAPSLSMAPPRFDGNDEETSLLKREASLHPRPDVVTPTWRGPSEYVESNVNVQSSGASDILTGILRRRHSFEMCGPITMLEIGPWLEHTHDLHTQWVITAQSNKNHVHHMLNFFPPQSRQVVILEFSACPFCRTTLNALRQCIL